MLAGLAERPAERVRGSISEDAMKHTGISGSFNLGLIYPYTFYIAQPLEHPSQLCLWPRALRGS